MTNTSIEKVLAEVLKMRMAYATDAGSDSTAKNVIDDIIALLEQELVV